MISKLRFIFTTITVLMVFVFSAMWAKPAFADDSAPPPPVDAPTEVAPPTTSIPVVDQTAVPVAQDALAQVPQGTDVVVVNKSGDSIPLVSQQAAQAIVTGDPLWCPSGVAPKASTGGCSISYGSLSDLVAGGSHAANGTVWIENTADAGSEATFDGSGTWSSAANFSLTLQGGWVGGITGSKTILGVSTFDTAINIVHWSGNVTINDIAINGASNTAHPATGALYVATTKNITLSNVTVINTAYSSTSGAYLNNDNAAQSTVTIKNSSFNNNTSNAGLTINSFGAVALVNVNANKNNQYGVYINNSGDAVASPVTVTNSSFNGNTNLGLQIYSNGAVNLGQVTADNNGSTGINVDNYSTNVPDLHPQPVTVTGFLNAVHNNGSGLEIDSKGVVTLTNLTTSYNLSDGTNIDNTHGTLQAAVNLSGTNLFSSNYSHGLKIASRGAITLNNVSAIFNGVTSNSNGVYIYNNYESTKPQNITLNGNNFFLYNGYDGLSATSYGAITINNVTATDNGKGIINGLGSGVYLDNSGALITKPANITINGISTFTGSDYAGLEAYSKGVITLSNVTASNNNIGVYVDNRYGTSAAVVLNGSNVFNQNSETGLTVYSHGAITVNNVTASNNSSSGAYLDNHQGLLPAAVVLNGSNTFNLNNGVGLTVLSEGAITANNVTASNASNSSNGAFLDNSYGTSAAVLLNGSNVFNQNGGTGLTIYSHGAITVNNVTASYNNSGGAYLDNHQGLLPAAVVLKGSNNFNHNNGVGLNILSEGAITANNVTASNAANSSSGAFLDNSYGTSAAVLLTGNNVFNQNAVTGLVVLSKGVITVNNVTAFQNQSNGVYLYNQNGTAQNGIFVNGFGLFEHNANDGLAAFSNGAITTYNLNADFNTGNGANLNTIGILKPQTVTLNGTNGFNFNGNAGSESGLIIKSDGLITVNNITADNNFYRGALLDNFTNWDFPATNFATFGSVVLTGFGNFSNNTNQGLYVYTHGAATLNYVSSNFNGNDGIGIDADGNVTLVCSSANNNVWGLYLYGTPVSVLTLKGFSAAGNTSTVNEFLNSPVTLVRTQCP